MHHLVILIGIKVLRLCLYENLNCFSILIKLLRILRSSFSISYIVFKHAIFKVIPIIDRMAKHILRCDSPILLSDNKDNKEI